jgi:hypothetical protein
VNPAVSDYHLCAGSPAINGAPVQADAPFDMEGNPRPTGSAADMGAYEYQGGGPAPTNKIFLPLVVKKPVS